jgi:hypothetical protein
MTVKVDEAAAATSEASRTTVAHDDRHPAPPAPYTQVVTRNVNVTNGAGMILTNDTVGNGWLNVTTTLALVSPPPGAGRGDRRGLAVSVVVE